jgi:membrane peptidoglycan carboxypeptidase
VRIAVSQRRSSTWSIGSNYGERRRSSILRAMLRRGSVEEPEVEKIEE